MNFTDLSVNYIVQELHIILCQTVKTQRKNLLPFVLIRHVWNYFAQKSKDRNVLF